MKNVGGKRESLSFYCQDRPLYIENVALEAMFSLSMLEHVQSIHEHSMYSMISMMKLQIVKKLDAFPFLSFTQERRFNRGASVCYNITLNSSLGISEGANL
jgi:hypothetical protein